MVHDDSAREQRSVAASRIFSTSVVCLHVQERHENDTFHQIRYLPLLLANVNGFTVGLVNIKVIAKQ